MSTSRKIWFGAYALLAAMVMCLPATAQQQQRPNILFIMGDDIGIMNVRLPPWSDGRGDAQHRPHRAGRHVVHDRLRGAELHRRAHIIYHRHEPVAGWHDHAAAAGLQHVPVARHPDLAVFLHDLGYNTGEFGKNHLGDKTNSLPTAHGFQEFWGYLYHLDAMQGVSFPDINKTPTDQAVVPPCKNTPVPGLSDPPGAVDPTTTLCMTPPRPVIWCKSSDGTEAHQSCQDEGPLTLDRSTTVDEEISAKVVDYLDRNDPKKTNKPFFVWYNPARMHITTMFSPKYMAMLGTKGGKDWGINEVGMKQLDDNVGVVLAKLEAMGQLDNTIVVFTTDNGAEVITYPDGGVTPFRGGKLTTWEGGMRVPMMARWPGHIKPGTTNDQIFSMLDWLPTFVDIAGGPTGDGLKKQIEAGKYPGIIKTTLDGSTSAPTWRARANPRATTSSTTAVRIPRQCDTRTGSSTTPWHPRMPPAACWGSSPSTGRKWTTSSGIHLRRPSAPVDPPGHGWCPGRAEYGIPL